MKKLNITILYGGKSVEHEVSLMSARNVKDSMDKKKYNVFCIYIDKEGNWFDTGTNIEKSKKNKITSFPKTDVVFPIIHGTNGEDGILQGLLKFSNVPFVGPSVLGSALGFDKDVTKRLLNEAGIPNTPFLVFHNHDKISFAICKKKLGLPMIVKPANSGSSVGVNKIDNEKEFTKAVRDAFQFDNKILVEKFVTGKREIECAVLGNENPIASICGEVVTHGAHKFYSYEAKYFDPNGSSMEIPAQISKSLQKKLQEIAIRTYKVLELEGMTRVDFFLDDKNNFFVNEVNTIPGFTNMSMYPVLWEKTGLSKEKLIDRLITLAQERFAREKKLKLSI